MGSTIRDLGNTIKEAKSFLQSKKADEMLLDCEEPVDGSSEEENAWGSHQDMAQMSACIENAEEEDMPTTTRDNQLGVEFEQ